MPIPPVVAGSPASCGHPATGSTRVFIMGLGVSRSGLDFAGGLITGPGQPRVIIETNPVSVVADLIASHGNSPHSAAVTTSIQNRVLVG